MSSTTPNLRQRLAATEARSLILRARQLAAGWAAGTHRADRKGSGVEFAGHRSYTPGDDLRHLDRHALLRHQKFLIREFFTDTERAVHVVIDATASMRYRGADPGSETASKAEMALLLGTALCFIARQAGDHVGLTTVSPASTVSFKPQAGREAFERIIHHCEDLDSQPDAAPPKGAESAQLDWEAVFDVLGSTLPRGTLIYVLSDFLDTSTEVQRSLAALATRRRTVRALQVLTPEEVKFPFNGSLRLQDLETGREVETDAAGVRAQYQAALLELTRQLSAELSHQGGALLRCMTTDPPEEALRFLASGQAPQRSDWA